MSATSELRNYRSKGYGPASDKEGDDLGDSPRQIKVTDDESKQFEGVEPGTDVACEVHGTFDNGMLHVMSIQPLQKQSEQGDMSKEVMQRVMPNVIPSPS